MCVCVDVCVYNIIVHMYVCVDVCVYEIIVHTCVCAMISYGVATISRLLRILGLFCRI